MNDTRRLLIAVLVLGGVDLGVWWLGRAPAAEVLPSIPAFDPSEATAIRLVGPADDLGLVRTGEGWQLTAPVDAPADPVEVEAVLSTLAGGIRPDLRIGDTAHETYGLSGGEELRVEVDGASGRLAAFYVGRDAGGGATWIRLPDADDVYRARIGGRARFDRPAGGWRDRRVTDLDPAAITGWSVHAGDRVWGATRAGDGWTGSPEPVDGPTVERLVAELARLRAAEVTGSAADPVPWDGPTVELRTEEDIVRLTFGGDGAARYVRRDDRDDRWRISAPWLPLLSDPATVRDRALWTASRVDRFVLRAPGREGILARERDAWRIERPANVDLDPARADAVAAWLARPRVLAWGADAASFSGGHSWEISADGQQRRIELGPPDGDRVPIRVDGRTGWIEARVVQVAEGLFGG